MTTPTRPLQRPVNNILVAAIGDSLTRIPSLSVLDTEHYPHQLQTLLRAAGARVQMVNCGVGGNRTGQMLWRRDCMVQHGVPALAIIFGGTNDSPFFDTTVQASPAPTTSVFAVGAGKAALIANANDSWIKLNGVSMQISAIDTVLDKLTLTVPLGAPPVAGQAVVIDTKKNLQELVRLSLLAGIPRILVCTMIYANFTPSGDTVSVENATHAALRAIQRQVVIDAAAPTQVVLCDLFAHMKALIVAGTVTQNDWVKWHVANGDIHMNAPGGLIAATAGFNAITGAPGWLATLS